LPLLELYEAQKYLSTTRHMYNPLLVLFSKKVWNRLTEDEHKLLLEAAEEVKSYQRQVSGNMDAKVLEQLRGHGMTVIEISEEERARMAEKLKPVTEKYTEVADPELVGELNAQLAKLRGTN